MTQHTPAPWYTDGHLVGHVQPGDHETVKTLIATVTDGQPYNLQNTDEKTRQANAALIAAAPELLAACEYVVKWHREHDSGAGELFGLDFVTTCIAAISKATNI
jgi:hypothetical protein